jgi:hypothetical protein
MTFSSIVAARIASLSSFTSAAFLCRSEWPGVARYCDSAMPAARITLPQRSISDLT